MLSVSEKSSSSVVVRCIAGVLVIAVLAALAVAGIRHLRNMGEREETAIQFHFLTIAFSNYCDVHGHLPELACHARSSDTGAALDQEILYGWRFTLIPFSTGLNGGTDYPGRHYVDFDSPWTSESNAWLEDIELPEYCYDREHQTRVLAVTGPGTAWGDGSTMPLSVADVPADTILIVESAQSGIHWAAPGDLDIRAMPRTINDPSGRGISSRSPTGFCVGFAGGRVWCLSHEVPYSTLEKFFTIDGAMEHDADELLAPYRIELR